MGVAVRGRGWDARYVHGHRGGSSVQGRGGGVC